MIICHPVDDYKLGMECSTGKIFRIPNEYIPRGLVRIVKGRPRYTMSKLSPYYASGKLREEYWALRRKF